MSATSHILFLFQEREFVTLLSMTNQTLIVFAIHTSQTYTQNCSESIKNRPSGQLHHSSSLSK